MSPFFSYFGSKHRIAVKYPPPRHDTIVEPFAGSAGYAVRHYWRQVVLVDKDPAIIALWRYLVRVSAREIMRLPDLEIGAGVDGLNVSDEARLLIGFNVNQAVSGPRNTLTSWGTWGPAHRARVAVQVERIRHWQIIEGSYELAPDVDATWFVDPPYAEMGKHYRCGADAIDFAALATWCRSRRGQVMVCENEGAEWLPFRRFHNARSARPRVGEVLTDAVSREVIWTNDPPARVLL